MIWIVSEFTFAPLSPVRLLDRAVSAFSGQVAVIDGPRRYTYAEYAARCQSLATALKSRGIRPGDRVAALCANSAMMLELHQASPAMGAVLVPLNVRLSPTEISYILDHSGARILLATDEHAELAATFSDRVEVVAGEKAYEDLLSSAAATRPQDREQHGIGHDGQAQSRPADGVDERDLLAINYTSGTTGRPKGVMYHHRGAYLQAIAMAHHSGLKPGAGYLWTLPMFHCNGWCFTWAVTAVGGVHHCLRSVEPTSIWDMLRGGEVARFSAAPTVLGMVADSAAAVTLPREVGVDTGGAPPSPTLIRRLAELNLHVTHLYGMTETFGPIAINDWQPRWDGAAPEVQVRLQARQGVSNLVSSPLRVLDEGGAAVCADGETIGELAVSGNTVMLGYYRDDEATEAVSRAGAMLTGDLAVMHPDGYVEIRDRRKDIIISGGENISSVEVERVLDSHPDVAESAVVGTPHEKWGEIPVAFISSRSQTLTAETLIEYARTHLAGYKVPRHYQFTDLPKTSTGKIQKNILRDWAQRPAQNFSPVQD